ncbi:MAG TPA: Gp37 family protein [Candidatus Binataceae bacterium]|nr:Gp37 family protein [Candidatus Binataceae bacterium]
MPSPGQEGVPFLDDITQYPAGTQYAPTIATDPWTVQASIIQRLQYSQSQGNQGLAKVGIAAYADRPETWVSIPAAGQVLVGFAGSDYSEPEDIGQIVHRRTMDFSVGIISRVMGYATATGIGAGAILEGVRTALMGWQPLGCSRLWVHQRDDFKGRDPKGTFYIYEIIFRCWTEVVESDDPYTLVNFQTGIINATVNGENGTETESVNTESGPL